MIDFHRYEICRNCTFYEEFGIGIDCGLCGNEEADEYCEEVDAEYSCFDYEEKEEEW